jgi:hypothetical protein
VTAGARSDQISESEGDKEIGPIGPMGHIRPIGHMRRTHRNDLTPITLVLPGNAGVFEIRVPAEQRRHLRY